MGILLDISSNEHDEVSKFYYEYSRFNTWNEYYEYSRTYLLTSYLASSHSQNMTRLVTAIDANAHLG